MKIIFVVDDNETNLAAARQALDEKFKVYALISTARMFKLAEKIKPDLILLDVDMPKMDGFDTMAALKTNELLENVPVAFVAAKNDAESEIRGFEMGALDFISKPISPPVLLRRVENHLKMDELIKSSIASLKEAYIFTIGSIASLVDSRDELTGEHSMRVQKYIEVLVKHLARAGGYIHEVSKWDISALITSSRLHDMGKIVVSDSILNKKGRLTDEEFNIMKTHSTEGEKLIDGIICETGADSFLIHAKRFAGSHHEKYDGTGYPRGLEGETIPLEGRIMAIADVYDALVNVRPYKAAFSHEDAVEIIKKDSGTHFDPAIVKAFLEVSEDFWVESISGGEIRIW